MAVGGESELEALAARGPSAGGCTRQMVVPGITDAHLHLMALVLAEIADRSDRHGPATRARPPLARAHSARVAARRPDGWLLGPRLVDARPGWLARRATCSSASRRAGRSRCTRTTTTRAGSVDAAMRMARHHSGEEAAGALVRRDEQRRATGILHEGGRRSSTSAIPDPDTTTSSSQRLEVGRAATGRRSA